MNKFIQFALICVVVLFATAPALAADEATKPSALINFTGSFSGEASSSSARLSASASSPRSDREHGPSTGSGRQHSNGDDHRRRGSYRRLHVLRVVHHVGPGNLVLPPFVFAPDFVKLSLS